MKMIRLFSCLVLLCCFFTGAYGQQVKNYEEAWRRVDDLVEKRKLPKSALEEVNKIYQAAKRENQNAQIIKALVYISALQQENREDNLKTSILELEKEIPQLREPALSILKSLIATKYRQYLQMYRWQLYNRTSTVNFSKEDIATWTLDDFHNRISELLLQSIEPEKLLQQTRLAPYDAIIVKGNVRQLRPTLYDLLAHQALDYFRNDERDIRKPAYSFSIEQPQAFAPAAEFIAYRFTTADSSSLQQKALTVFQKLIAFHLGDAQPDALIDVDISRIRFVYQNATLDNKDDRYLEALRAITAKYPQRPAAAQAWYLMALHHHQLAAGYQPHGDTTYRYERLKAREILERVVRDSAVKSEGWTNSYNLLKEVDQTEYSFEVEKVNLPGQPFRSLVRYRNVTGLHFRLINATEDIKQMLQMGRDDRYWAALRKAAPLRSWQQPLPATNDLQTHSVEIKLDALPVGEYVLLASPDAKFAAGKPLGAQIFYVSGISYVAQGNQFFVLHRETGQPLQNASVEVFTQEYNYNSSRYIKRKQGDYKTDRNGHFAINNREAVNQRGYALTITHGSDRLALNDVIYNYYYEGMDRVQQERGIFFFTDRSLYRPGQLVYFKGIVINRNADQNTIATNYATTVYLRNANYELVDSLKVTTNEFGSFNGTFILPQNVLNGNFFIADQENRNQVNFSVEEYKRPKFYVTFDKVKNTYKLGDSVTVSAGAKAYAGNNIDGAKVSYRVVRQPRFVYPWLWRIWPPRGEPMEVAHGTATTDADGNFSVSFVAIPDKKIDRRFDPVFDYRIYADVTDMAGETRSGETIVSAGYKSLLLKVAVPERVAGDSLKSISIRTENMSGAFQPSQVTVSFTSLVPEQRLVRKRYWEQPDQFLMSKEEFVNYFPHDEYRNETDFKTWEKGATLYRRSDTSTNNSLFRLPGANFAPGFYLVEVITKDREGAEVKDLRYVEIYKEGSNKLNRPEYLWTKSGRPIEPGETTSVEVGSSAANVFLVRQVDRSRTGQVSTGEMQFTTLNNERKEFRFGATEKDRGGYGLTFFFIKDNRLYQYQEVIRVPWTNKELKVEYATFRDKTLPGSEEQWKVKISGWKNEQVAAEMLAAMYDASLDQFRLHGWSSPRIWPEYRGRPGWQGVQNFASVQSFRNHAGVTDIRLFKKEYDRFIFDNSYYGDRLALQEVALTGKAAGVAPAAAPQAMRRSMVANEVKQGMETEDMALADADTASVPKVSGDPSQVHIRKNFNETAFFFPELRTDQEGNIEFRFTAPEALTRWKLQTLAHTKELAFGYAQQELVTQKELMVQPNVPRFLRQGDQMELSTKIVNLSGGELSGQAELQLLDAATRQPVDAAFGNIGRQQNFTVAAGQSKALSFTVRVPQDFSSALVWRIVAQAGQGAQVWSDGEENTIPVLSNKLLVTETMPLPVRGSGTRTFSFEKLLKSGNSHTLQHHALTVEFTANPAWYAVQALPYLMEQSTETVDQVWNRYYANSLATAIVKAAPRIRQIFERWKTIDTAALLSNLQKNQELKSALLQETPWVLQAASETQQKKNIAFLFDMVKMSSELQSAVQKLKEFQSPNGGFVWCKGAPEDRYMTQHIVTGIGHLKKLNAVVAGQEDELNALLKTAIPYLDRKIKADYDNLLKSKAAMDQQVPGYVQVQYLYLRSFFPEVPLQTSSRAAYDHFRRQSYRTWTKQNKYMQGMIALALHRAKDLQTPVDILRSLKETAIVHEETGMYWQDQRFGHSWFWWHAPIETQALLIEAFSEISKDTAAVDDMRTWLIKNKQTNHWHTGRATADAVYAFLLQGTGPATIGWVENEPVVQIQLGSTTVSTTDQDTEAGTGYFRKTFDAQQVTPAMGAIKVTMQASTGSTGQPPAWGAVYWQYFEDMDKITSAATPLQLNKKLFVEKYSDRGPVLTPLANGNILAIGDKVKVRIELKVDRDMEYVHMKDLRASAFEPVNVLSGYKWQGGLGYYETTKDVSTSFYFPYLRKGTYVFEYPMFVTHAGEFSNGITTIQCFYAPEFSAHSEGVRVKVNAEGMGQR